MQTWTLCVTDDITDTMQTWTHCVIDDITDTMQSWTDRYTKKYALQKIGPRNFLSAAKRNRPNKAIVVAGISNILCLDSNCSHLNKIKRHYMHEYEIK